MGRKKKDAEPDVIEAAGGVLWRDQDGERQVAVVHRPLYDDWSFPKGKLDKNESWQQAALREVREETGLEIEVGKFIHFKEDFFYYDPLDEAFHSLLFFYICKPITFEFAAGSQIDDGEAENPRWVEKQGLKLEDFQSHGEEILEILSSLNGKKPVVFNG